ncbi:MULTISPECIES: SAM-dependent methyltransferase [Borrelia]|uniref:Ribosomal RNA large subunit methyltransferase E n=2 Tax=Borrelia TaxID=138 RepID=RLME_BORDL|nr:RlmE family RNA methyltransferase [Borrelia recurrentis]B5RLD9.1 RecName: Full=Ribosomal RNA large subunit methyltransferase E; AltName: Full=23S rRNA Um2552 methyltransferase; AltName: Full=rRNA (uridine-2'-O-)-methyltransferase [Borrelia duttonii Ly]B5RRD2.1 RecName: Full=Ribosomal RNA large subunit methyltransferase E; AltName: Full=23S rRNA Um2552 methyltransferase; AltName: Full=rRNA (uridine-2'-O-)-methyltransferase [Borrelia recurrentis A1]ACH93268.1 ribosomal RNA methyltransferase [Bo
MYNVFDEYSQKAKNEGYLARSVYKLIEIDKKFSLFSSGNILDIGASPGSFSQYAYANLKNGVLVAVDLNDVNLNFTSNFYFIKGNIYLDEVYQKIKIFSPYSLIVSDAAPSTTGNRLVDTSNSFNLNIRIFELACESLMRGGNLLIKVFQGGEEEQIFYKLKSCFRVVKKVRPKAVRKNSFEIYFLAKDFAKL